MQAGRRTVGERESGVYSQCLVSHWSRVEYILSAWHPIGHTHRENAQASHKPTEERRGHVREECALDWRGKYLVHYKFVEIWNRRRHRPFEHI